MLGQITSSIQKQLTSKPFIKLQSISMMFPDTKINAVLRQMMNSAQKSQLNFELVCYLTIEKEKTVLMQYDRWSNIAQGFIVYESANFEEKIEVKHQELKDFKVVGFSKKQIPLSELKAQFNLSNTPKKHKYINKQILGLKKGLSQGSQKPTKIKETKKQDPVKESVKKPVQTIHPTGKPKIEQSRPKNLQKRTTKELNNTKPTQSQTDNRLNNEEIKQSNGRALKMNIQSDQDYYERNEFNKMMDIQPGKDTDCSGKKKNDQECKETSRPVVPMSKFIEDDSEDEDLFAKMDKVPKKVQPQKEQTIKTQQKVAHSQKIQNPPKKAAVGASVAPKGGLMGWLSKK